jgi:integrase
MPHISEKANITQEFVTKKLRELKEAPDKGAISIEYKDIKLPGFLVDIGASGKNISYRVNGRIKNGKTLTITIGKHGVYNATEAREEAAKKLRLMKEGIDPRALLHEMQKESAEIEQKQTIEDLRKSLTVRAVFEQWSEDSQNKPDTKKLYRQVIFKHLKDWLDKPMSEITVDMVVTRYDQVAKQTVSSAGNTFRALRSIYNWLIIQYEEKLTEPIIDKNPVLTLSRRKKWQTTEPRNDEYIADQDLKAWYSAVRGLDNTVFADYFTLLLLTGLRKDEAAGMLRADVDFKRGRFTVRDTKNKQDHTLPMTPVIRSLLERRCVGGSEYVFPGKNDYIKDVTKYQELVTEASGVEFTPHWLRRTFSYAAERSRLGMIEHKKLLNHLSKGNVTTNNYSPRDIDNLLEPLQMVQDFLLQKAGVSDV